MDSVRSAKPTEQLANPFRPGNGVRPPYLAGRDRPLADFDSFVRERPIHPNWALTGLRGTGKTVLLSEFAARAEGAGWVTLRREMGERHRDDARLADAIEEDVDALLRRLSPLAGVGQAVQEGVRQLRPRRVTIGELGYEPAYAERPTDSADRMRVRLSELDTQVAGSDRPGALLLYDEAHLLADDKARERYPLSSLLAALGQAQRSEPRIRFVLCGLPTLSLNLKRARTYAERMFRHVVVGNLDRSDAWDALALPLAAAGRSFGLAVVADIVEATAGYPYFLQFFGAYLCRSVGRLSLTSVADVGEASRGEGTNGTPRLHERVYCGRMIASDPTVACPTHPPLAERELLDAADARRLEALFGVLASAPRLRLVHALVRSGELPLGELAAAVDMSPQAASNQLTRLLDLGVVASERRGTHVFYRLVDPCVAGLLDEGLCLAEESARWRP